MNYLVKKGIAGQAVIVNVSLWVGNVFAKIRIKIPVNLF
ncbi:MAG: hypothetical protein MRERV_5c056 [Mycoplasmataceae bacterium RV_VA103A]|nr:MAG: hypothetical protein MRERV_5c056 [Mycoplasmataceae bacterium RV_VA103A]